MEWHKKVDLKALFGEKVDYSLVCKSQKSSISSGPVPGQPILPPPAYTQPMYPAAPLVPAGPKPKPNKRIVANREEDK